MPEQQQDLILANILTSEEIERILDEALKEAAQAGPPSGQTPTPAPTGGFSVLEWLKSLFGGGGSASPPAPPASPSPASPAGAPSLIVPLSRERLLKEIAPQHGGIVSSGPRTDLPMVDEIQGRVVPTEVRFNDGTYLVLRPLKDQDGFVVIGGNALQPRTAQTRQIAGATPRERHLIFLTPEGQVQAVPNPNYDPTLAEAERARARYQAELDRIRADLEARRLSLEEARQQAEEAYRRFQQEAERARLQATLRGQDIDLARSVLAHSADLLSRSLPFMAPPGTAEDFARLLDAFRTGQLPAITPRPMRFPFNPRTIGLELARQVLQTLPVPPAPTLPGETTAPAPAPPALPPVGGRLSPEPPPGPWPGTAPQDFWGPALQAPRPGRMVPPGSPSSTGQAPTPETPPGPRPESMIPGRDIPLLPPVPLPQIGEIVRQILRQAAQGGVITGPTLGAWP